MIVVVRLVLSAGVLGALVLEGNATFRLMIGETEIMTGVGSTSDSLETTFMAEEETAELKAELSLLLNTDEERPS